MPDPTRQIDDNQDDLGRDVNDPDNRIGDRPTVDKTDEDSGEQKRRDDADPGRDDGSD